MTNLTIAIDAREFGVDRDVLWRLVRRAHDLPGRGAIAKRRLQPESARQQPTA